MKVTPYININGSMTFTDDYIMNLWNRMVDDGTAHVVFQNGRVNNAYQFLDFVKDQKNLVCLIFDGEEICLLAWLNNIDDGTAQCHFNAFSNAWGGRAVEAFDACFRYWFGFVKDGEPVLRVITGMIPSTNSRACGFARKFGTFLGEIPNYQKNAHTGAISPVSIFYTERKKWVE